MTDRLLGLIDSVSARRVLVVGDLIIDEFIRGRPERMSREAPVLILQHADTAVVPGGAGNAAANVAALGGNTSLVALAGDTDRDARVAEALDGVDLGGLVRAAGYRAPLKTRILAGGLHATSQQVVRIDRDARVPPEAGVRSAIESAALQALDSADAVLVSDYGAGLVTPELVARIQAAAAQAQPPRTIPVVVDSRRALLSYTGVAAATPNEAEAEEALGFTIGDDPQRLERAGRELLERLQAGGLVLTRGSRGMAVFVPGRPTLRIPVFGTDEVADVTGAGDTVIAAVALALAAGAALEDAARLANYAGGVVVMKRGTATVSAAELRRAVQADGAGRGR